MEKKLIDRWIEALRSGEYEQATGKLRKVVDEEGTYGYCCLGVLTHIANSRHPDLIDEKEYLPGDVMEMLAEEEKNQELTKYPGDIRLQCIVGRDGIVAGYKGMKHRKLYASALNDDHGWDFNQIADAVERTFRGGKETN